MDQRVGFCTIADGARIAYATMGSGSPLVAARYAPSHLGLESKEPRIRRFWEAIGQHHLVVRYDRHGCGLSDRNRIDFSLDSEVRTIETIVNELRLTSFALWGEGGQGGAAAIGYAVKSPERVSHLILTNAQARWHGAPTLGSLSHDTFRSLMATSFRMSSLAMAEAMFGNKFDAATLRRYLRFRQEATSPEVAGLATALLWNLDVRDLLPKVKVPTLVIHYRENRLIPFEAGREVAAGIPGARLVPLEGDSHIFFFTDTRPLLRA